MGELGEEGPRSLHFARLRRTTVGMTEGGGSAYSPPGSIGGLMVGKFSAGLRVINQPSKKEIGQVSSEKSDNPYPIGDGPRQRGKFHATYLL